MMLPSQVLKGLSPCRGVTSPTALLIRLEMGEAPWPVNRTRRLGLLLQPALGRWQQGRRGLCSS